MELTISQRVYIINYRDRQRDANKKATEASNRWQERKAWLKAYAIENNYDLTEKPYRDLMTNDWQLKDAMDDWKWFAGEASRCHDAIDTELKVSEVMPVARVPRQRSRDV